MNIQDAMVYSKKILRETAPSMRLKDGEDFEQWQSKVYDKLYELLGLAEFKQCDDNFTVCYEKEHDSYTETRFTFNSEADYIVPCHLLMPKNVKTPCKLVICIQGHSKGMHISLGQAKYEGDELSISGGDRDFAVRAVKEGYAAIAIEQRYMGESGGNEHGPQCVSGNSLTTLLLGRCAIGERVWDVMRLIDVITAHFDCLDSENIICLGNSGGGTTTFYAACMDSRIKCAVPSCSVCTYKDSIGAVYHCTCNYIPGIAKYFDMGDLAGLIAPRKLVIVHGKKDDIFPENGVMETFDIVKKLYEVAGCPSNAALVTGSEGHRFYADQAWSVIHKMMD